MEVLVSDAQRREMEESGFTVFPAVFSREEMTSLDALLEAHERKMNEDLQRRGGSSGISRANEITFTTHIAEQDDQVAMFVRRQEFVNIACEFLGPDVDLYWNQTVFKHPEGEKVFPWHQDDAYTAVEPSPYLTLWLAVGDATEENGCVSVLPGSHKQGLRPHESTEIGLTGYSEDEEDQGVLVPVDAGGVVAFWSLTLHKSGRNRSQDIRKAYVIQYCKAGTRKVANGERVGTLPLARNGIAAPL
jgi:phytanoyl-CoA hydroxylase